jgi:ABC-type siderophore export system fused ATPase/permease subunit
VVVNSTEYDNLLKDKEIANQLKKDNEVLTKAKKEFDAERTRQQEMRDKMVKDLNIMQKKLVEKDLAILWRNVIIAVLLGVIGGYIYLRMNSGFKLF